MPMTRDALQADAIAKRAVYEAANAAYMLRLNRDLREAEAQGWAVSGVATAADGTQTYTLTDGTDSLDGVPDFANGDSGGYVETLE